jgi:hypothetical protein
MGGTSMAAPYVAGLAALLASAVQQDERSWTGAQLLQALRASAQPFPGEATIDQGAGLPRLDRAYAWLREDHEVVRYRVEALGAAPATPRGLQRSGGARGGVAMAIRSSGATAAFRPTGLASSDDTVQRFRVSLVPDPGIARRPRSFHLTSDATWLRPATATSTLDSATGSLVVEVRYDPSRLSRPGRYSGAVLATSATDSAAGPAFVLPNTVIVPDTASDGIAVRGRRLTGAASDRYYVRVSPGADGLVVRLAVRDTSMAGTLYLYEPTARPARGDKEADVGGSSGRTAELRVASEDLVPGVYEVVVQAMPGQGLAYDLAARVPAIRAEVAAAADTVVVSEAPPDTGATVAIDEVGVASDWQVSIDSGRTVRRTALAPAWATTAVLEVELSPDTWDRVTDFALTLYDSLRAQLGNGAMNYPYHRVSAELPQHRPARYALMWELFPAFADTVPPARVEARVRLRFEGQPRSLLPAQHVPADGRVALPPAPAREAPEGMRPLLQLRIGTPTDSMAITKLLVR